MILHSMIERIKRLDLTQKSGWKNMALKPISLVLTCLYTPLLLGYLGEEKYGLWSTILAIISWINYFDVGIGNGLRNFLSENISNKEIKIIQKAVSTAYCILSGVSFIFFIILVIFIRLLNWNKILNTNIGINKVLFISIFFICINFVMALSNTILYALQCAEKVAIRNICVQILNILGLVILRLITKENLELLALLFGGTQLIVNIGNTIHIMNNYSFFRIRMELFEPKLISSICNVGIKFFIIQIMCLIMFTTDNLLITYFWGPSEVTNFSIVDKVFNLIYSFFAAFMVPYWSGTTRAYASNDFEWIKKALLNTIKMFFLFFFLFLIAIPFFKPVVGMWLGRELIYQDGLISLMAFFYIIYSILAIECHFINGIGKIRFQMYLYLIMGVLNIPLSIFLGVTCNLQSLGIRLATLILIVLGTIALGINLYKIIVINCNK